MPAPIAASSASIPADRPHLRHWPTRLPRELVIPETSLWFNLEVSARRYPNKPLYIFFGKRFSFAEVHAQAERLAGWLQQVGVGTGDRVSLYMQNCPQYAVAYYAILRANAVVVPVNPMNRADEFGHYIVDPGAKVVICSADLAGFVHTANAALPAAQRATEVLVTRYADTMDDAADIDPGDAPPAAMNDWLRADPPLPEGTGARWTRWHDAWPAPRRPGRTRRRPTTWPSCPTPRAPPATPRAACTATAR